MKTYADTSLLFSLYGTDSHSPKADAWRRANPVPLPFTAFHRVELRNALSLAVFQQRLTPLEVQTAYIPKTLHDKTKINLIRQGNREFSALIEELHTAWNDKQSDLSDF